MVDQVPLALAVASALAFLEHSPECIVALDDSVKAMEGIGYELQQLSETDQRELRRLYESLAKSTGDTFLAEVPVIVDLAT